MTTPVGRLIRVSRPEWPRLGLAAFLGALACIHAPTRAAGVPSIGEITVRRPPRRPIRMPRPPAAKKARASGEAETLFGRKRPIPELHSRNRAQREFAERTFMASGRNRYSQPESFRDFRKCRRSGRNHQQ